MAPASERQHSRQSSASSEEDLGTRSVAVSVLKDSGTKVEIMLKAHGLKKKKSLFNSLVTVFKKPSQPSRLLANGKFTEFTLTEHSLRFLLEVKTDKKKKKGNGNRLDTFLCEVKRFPSDVNPDSAEFEVLEPASGEAFILLTLIKVGNLSTNWKEFLDSNGTIDVSTI
ncbi:hypothetical protein L3Y34_003773 [Caenorhabditis briggsae]|nr:hypothetical protein L3Y34_003773 [Caenorhabditis briggsae]